jgi:hypothetical protein
MDMIEQAFASDVFHADRDASLADCITPADVVAEALWVSGLRRRDIEALVDKYTTPEGEPRPFGGGNVVPLRR